MFYILLVSLGLRSRYSVHHFVSSLIHEHLDKFWVNWKKRHVFCTKKIEENLIIFGLLVDRTAYHITSWQNHNFTACGYMNL